MAAGRSTLVAARTAVPKGDTGERLRPVAEAGMSPTLLRSVVAEFVGTALLVFLAVGTAVAGIDTMGWLAVAFAFGLVVLALAYAIGPISGCHVNPAVTLGVLLAKGMTATEAAYYWVAQFAGAIVGAALLQLMTSGFGDVTRLSHHGTSIEWCSRAMKFSVAAAVWTLAMNDTGLPAKCMAIGTPCSMAKSPIFFVSRRPPAEARSGWIMSTAPMVMSFAKSSFR